jgi:hypothetical protein
MKIDEAIYMHRNWKIKVADYIFSPDKSLKPEACHERCCELSQWLQSDEAQSILSKNELNDLIKAHKAFHHTLAEIVLNANRGVEISEEIALGIDSTFHRHSESMIRILNKIKSKIDDVAA